MSAPLSLLLLGFERLFRECLVEALLEDLDLAILDPGCGEPEALDRVERLRPDVVVINAGFAGDPVALLQQAGRRSPRSKLVVSGLAGREEEVLRWIEAGAHGYLVRDASLADFKEAVESVARGEMVQSPEVAAGLFCRLAELARLHRQLQALDSLVLSQRELEVLRQISQGLGNQQIAAHLCLSLHTVKNHVQNIFQKLNVRNRIEAVETARRQGWLTRE